MLYFAVVAETGISTMFPAFVEKSMPCRIEALSGPLSSEFAILQLGEKGGPILEGAGGRAEVGAEVRFQVWLKRIEVCGSMEG